MNQGNTRRKSLKKTQKNKPGGVGTTQTKQLRKSSSQNSMFISTTINSPCVDSIINAVATILNSQMLEVS